MDCTTWPEGFEELKTLLDFLPEDDDEARTAFLIAFLGFAVNL